MLHAPEVAKGSREEWAAKARSIKVALRKRSAGSAAGVVLSAFCTYPAMAGSIINCGNAINSYAPSFSAAQAGVMDEHTAAGLRHALQR